ncbi:hypothetical protein vseg_011629 [Gypsophila vaccaria]
MARKTNIQRHRQLQLRGRNITGTQDEQSRSPELRPEGEVEDDSAKPKGPSEEEDNMKTKRIHDIIGIPELHIESDEEEEGELQDTNTSEKQSMEHENRDNGEHPNTEAPLLQIALEDVQEEIDYWKNAVVCFILGANPPPMVIEGFIRRIWTRYNIDKISFLPNGIFLVRFKDGDMKEQVLKSGHFLFDNKPLIVNDWSAELELHKAEVKKVSVWIQLHNLPIKFWGKSLPKIAGLVGHFIKTDQATEQKTRLGYAMVMVEMEVEHTCPPNLSFLDEKGAKQQIEVHYEWKPITCPHCKGMGHQLGECRKKSQPKERPKQPTQVWRPVVKRPQKEEAVKVPDDPPSTPIQPISARGGGEETRGGYSAEKFGAISYRDILSSTQHMEQRQNGNESSTHTSHG